MLDDRLRLIHPAVRFVRERRLRAILAERIAAGERLPNNVDLPLWHDGELLLTPPDDRNWFGAAEDDLVRVYESLIRSAKPGDPAHWQTLNDAQKREARFVLESEQRLPLNATDDEVAAAFSSWHAVMDDEQFADTFPLSSPPTASVEKTAEAHHTRSVSPAMSSPGVDRNYIRLMIAGDDAAFEQFAVLLQPFLGDPRSALQPLVAAARNHTWPREKRALYDLQRFLADAHGTLEAVDPIGSLTSLGRKPLRRDLAPVRDVILIRRLRSVAKHLERSSLSQEQRQPIEHLIDVALHRFEHSIREQYRPIIAGIFDRVGHVATNEPERVGRAASIEELLDRLTETGFLRMADVRDAIARNHLKMPDITQGRDPLLRADRLLADALYGVYHRGEIYLRGIQRFSSVAFGSAVGRWLTLWIALPFGGAFLAIEAIKHLAHAFEALAALIVPPAAPPEKHHHPASFDASILILGMMLLLIINVPPARRLAWGLTTSIGSVLRFIFTAPVRLYASAPVQWLVNNQVVRILNAYVLLPAVLTGSVMLTLTILGVRTDIVAALGLVTFIIAALTSLTPFGARLREDFAEAAHDMGRRVVGEILPGIFNGVLWLFREALGALERLLYAIDEWFRYREGQSKPLLALKVVLALAWFPFAYVLRFAFYLLLEPQVNPIKHFPVVTVSHKVLLPLIPSVASTLHVSLETATALISGIPGVFGFLVWEFKENWKLYAANRPRSWPAAMIGHHGETVRGYLRPGFHSGTVPKLFRKLRRGWQEPYSDPARRDRLLHDRAHIVETLVRLAERHLIAYTTEPHSVIATLGVQRVEFTIDTLRLSVEHIDGTIVGVVTRWGWAEQQRELVQQFLTTAAVENPLNLSPTLVSLEETP